MANLAVIDSGTSGPGPDITVATNEVNVDGALGTAQVQYFKLVDGTIGGTQSIKGDADGLFTKAKHAYVAALTAGWTSATGVDTALALDVKGLSTAVISFNPSGTITAGSIIFEGSDDEGTTWHRLRAERIGNLNVDGYPVPKLESSYALLGIARLWHVPVAGLTDVRVRLNPIIGGAGTANLRLQAIAATSPTFVPVSIVDAAGDIQSFAPDHTLATGPGSARIANGSVFMDKLEDDPAATGDPGFPFLGVRNDGAAARTSADGDYGFIALDSAGRVGISDLGGSITVDFTAALPAGGNNIGDVDVLTVPADPFGANADAAVAAGATGSQSAKLRRLTSDLDAVKTSVELSDDTVFIDDGAFTPGTSKVQAIGAFADDAATDSVNEGDIGIPRMTPDRKLIVTNQPHDVGGCAIFRSLDLDETEEEVKATAGTVYGWYVANLATTTRFLKFYNDTAANVVVGTTTPVMTIPIPGNATDDVGANLLGANGIGFGTAITVAATTGLADNDTGAPAPNDVVVNLFFK